MPTKYCVPSQELMPNVLKVLDLLVLSIKAKEKGNKKPFHDKYTHFAAGAKAPKFAKSIGKRCVGLAIACLCSHRYEEAAKLLCILCQDRSVFEMFIFRASMIVLENLEMEDKDETIWKFIMEIQKLQLVNKREVQLEYIIRSLTNCVQEIRRKSEALMKEKRTKYLRKNPVLDPIFDAYYSFLDYVELFECYSGVTLSQVDTASELAITKFASLIEKPGDWDIFVLKLVEMLDTYKQIEEKEIEDVLSKYVECHPDNLNAHIYLCVYLNENNPDSEKLIRHLKIISEMSPSDARVLILLKKWRKSNQNCRKCLEKLFVFLDYPSNGKNQEAWEMMSDFLFCTKSCKNEKILSTIDTCWMSRCKSWHWLHYNPSQVSLLKEKDIALVASKVKVLSYFDKDHTYIQEVFKKFPVIQDLLKAPLQDIPEDDTSADML